MHGLRRGRVVDLARTVVDQGDRRRGRAIGAELELEEIARVAGDGHVLTDRGTVLVTRHQVAGDDRAALAGREPHVVDRRGIKRPHQDVVFPEAGVELERFDRAQVERDQGRGAVGPVDLHFLEDAAAVDRGRGLDVDDVDVTIVNNVVLGIVIESLLVQHVASHRDLVDARAAVEAVGSVAELPRSGVVVGTARQHIVPYSSNQQVVAGVAVQGVVVAFAHQVVFTTAAVHGVLTKTTKDLVVAAAGAHRVGTIACGNEVVAVTVGHAGDVVSIDQVVAAIGQDHVGAVAACDRLVTRVADDHVVIGAAVEQHTGIVEDHLGRVRVVFFGTQQLDAVFPGAATDGVSACRLGADPEQGWIDTDVVVAVATVDDQGTELGTGRLRRQLDQVAAAAGLEVNVVDVAVEPIKDELVAENAAAGAQRRDRRGQEELGLGAGGDDDEVLVCVVGAQRDKFVAKRCQLWRGVVLQVNPAPVDGAPQRQAGAGRRHLNGVVLRNVVCTALVVERQLASAWAGGVVLGPQQSVEAGKAVRAVDRAFEIELGNDLVDEALAGFEDRYLAEAEVDADPEERLEEDAQLAVHIEHALRAMADAREQFVAVELAVADHLVVSDKFGELVVEVELDQCLNAPFDAGLNQTADAQAGHRPHRGAEGDLGLV